MNPDQLKSSVVEMLRSVPDDNPVKELCALLLNDINDDRNVEFTLIRSDTSGSQLIEGLKSRLRAHGMAGGIRSGLFQTVQQLEINNEILQIVLVLTSSKSATIYASIPEGKVIGVTLFARTPDSPSSTPRG
jgi:hypothetical protein